jgi:tetratricopeptide (TPR) repeat protein
MARAEERLHQAGTTFREIGDRGGLSWVHGLLAFVRFHQGRFDEADTLAREVADDASHRDERWGRGMMLALQAALRLWEGRVPEAVALGEESRSLLRSIGDRFGETQAAGPLSRALVAAGRIAEADRVIEEGRSASALYGMVGYSGTMASGAAVHAGDGQRAAREARHALEDLQPRHVDAYDAAVTLALASLQLGRVDAAVEVVETARLQRPDHPNSCAVAALAALASGRIGDGVALAEVARSAVGATYFDLLLALIALGLGHALRGEVDASAGALDEAILIADRSGDVVMQGVTRLAAAEAAGALGHEDAASCRTDALSRLNSLALGCEGWATAIALAAHGGISLEPV